MGKRSEFEKVKNEYYPTPMKAVGVLVPFLPRRRFTYVEPCAGDGRLMEHLHVATDGNAQCSVFCDIEPNREDIPRKDAFHLTEEDVEDADAIITNPPWARDRKSGNRLPRMIEHFASMKPTWLLIDSDYKENVGARAIMAKYLLDYVPAGRQKWIEGSNNTGKDNCAWYCFDENARMISPLPRMWPRGSTPADPATLWLPDLRNRRPEIAA